MECCGAECCAACCACTVGKRDSLHDTVAERDAARLRGVANRAKRKDAS